ncbi:MAG: thioredoxin domain-containing protein [Acidobacteria bacterium]|nr:thioredoxin domain-containing protein [Acidobacteriota bacterium]
MDVRNRLGSEKSPYLLQHKDNPVGWYPWGDEAFAAAKAADRPIFLSIGYSTCHWCHVMERESFEDHEVAERLNEFFIPVKVDREERPDVDAVYMEAVQALTGQGGWPMSVFLTPDGRPFFAGTYFPKPAFLKVLARLRQAWTENRNLVEEQGQMLADAVARHGRQRRAGDLDESVLVAFLDSWTERFDPQHGGIGGAPKFPHAYDIQLLLRIHRRAGRSDALAMARKTLDEMARGGIYDHLGGGFHRYSVDGEWFVPHFEKMLYDQASLATAYVEGWQVTGQREYAIVAREILDYVLRDLCHPEGGFYSAEDADSEGEEGKFYVWTAAELRSLLDEREHRDLVEAYGVTDAGNWENGANILRLVGPHSRSGRSAELTWGMRKLFEARQKRVRPHLDDKVLTDWNGLMIASMARAGRALREPRYVHAAASAARFVLARCRADGALRHRWRDGEAAIDAFLDDYAFLVHGLIELYQATFEPEWLETAAELHELQDERFFDDVGADYFFTAHPEHPPEGPARLSARRVEQLDNVVPAGRSVTALNALRLAGLLARADLRRRADAVFESTPEVVTRHPGAFSQLLVALDFALDRSKEIAVVGPLQDEATLRMLDAVGGGFRPNQVIAAGSPGSARVPLLRGRQLREGRPTAYVCENHACQAPTTDPEQAARLADSHNRY